RNSVLNARRPRPTRRNNAPAPSAPGEGYRASANPLPPSPDRFAVVCLTPAKRCVLAVTYRLVCYRTPSGSVSSEDHTASSRRTVTFRGNRDHEKVTCERWRAVGACCLHLHRRCPHDGRRHQHVGADAAWRIDIVVDGIVAHL